MGKIIIEPTISILSVFLAQLDPKSLATKDLIDAAFKAFAVVGGILAALGSITAFFLTRCWQEQDRILKAREDGLLRREQEQSRRRELKEAERSKQRDVLYESLKWFEGGTQRRSIGISVVNSSWDAWPDFRQIWTEVLANQAIYLLTASDQGTKAHEHDNLRRIMAILMRERHLLSPATTALLIQTIKSKAAGREAKGLTLTEQLENRLKEWDIALES